MSVVVCDISTRKRPNTQTLVDEEDTHFFIGKKWWAIKKGKDGDGLRVCGTVNKKEVYLHRAIMNPAKGFVVDHINGNPLDNRRCNLRVCKQSDNVKNVRKISSNSGLKGVFKSGNKWVAQINHNRKSMYLGVFKIKEDAAQAYDKKATELHGQFVCTNEMLGLLK